MIQGTPEWFEARRGKITASRIGDVLAKAGTARRENYKAELICERLGGRGRESFTTQAMERGIELEPVARSVYEAEKGVFVNEEGFRFDETHFFGASPDGLIGFEGLLEIKCPNSSTHLDFLLKGKIKTDYIYQMQTNMIVWGRLWCDFVSYDPSFPDEYAIKIKRIEKDDDICRKIIDGVKVFEQEIIDTIAALRAS